MFKTLKVKLLRLHQILAQESKETKRMLEIYFSYSPSPQDLKFANKQFGDVLKTAGLGIFLILPAAPITFPLIIYLGKKFGIDVLPSSFKKEKAE